MNLNKKTTMEQILLNIFRNNQKVVDFLFNVKIVDKINDFEFKDLFEKPIRNYLIGKIKDDLRHKTGQRIDILTELFKGTPFEENFSYVKRFRNLDCQKKGAKHALAHHYNDRDANESQTYYCCVFCGEEWETTRGGAGINGTFIEAGGKAYDQFKELHLLLQKLVLQNPTDEEISSFVTRILDLTLGKIYPLGYVEFDMSERIFFASFFKRRLPERAKTPLSFEIFTGVGHITSGLGLTPRRSIEIYSLVEVIR